jgi:L-threonylcarbamoyladenylate synthase
MEIVKPNKIGIQKSIEVLRKNGTVVYPTDTAYALGGIFNSPKVVKDILKIKNRKDNKFTIVASSLYQVKKFFKFNSLQKKLAKQYWPAPLSIIVSVRFAVRVPKNKLCQQLSRAVGKPLIATSANLSGKKTLYDSKLIIKEFQNKKNQPDIIIDAGRLNKVKTSTIVLIKDEVQVLRSGSVVIK